MNRSSWRDASFSERRRQADWVVNAAALMSLVSWIFSIVVVFVMEQASPESPDFFTYNFGGVVRTTWDLRLLNISFWLLIFSVLVCVAAFIFNMMRMRRKTDKIRKSIVIIGIANLLGLSVFTLRFSSYLFG
jgi:hypothetical protein